MINIKIIHMEQKLIRAKKNLKTTYHFSNSIHLKTEQIAVSSDAQHPVYMPLWSLDKHLLEEAICSLSF